MEDDRISCVLYRKDGYVLPEPGLKKVIKRVVFVHVVLSYPSYFGQVYLKKNEAKTRYFLFCRKKMAELNERKLDEIH